MTGQTSGPKPESDAFSTTQWSLVLAAGDDRQPDSAEALAALCEHYWHPVYAQVRYSCHDAEAARDLTQGFFAELLEKGTLKVATPDRGRFRSFLKAALRNYLSHERRRENAQKRGAGRCPLALDFDTAESSHRIEPVDDRTPETVFERRWARTLLTRSLDRLRETMRESDGDETRFQRLEPFLTGLPRKGAHREAAEALGTTEAAVKMAVHRMRRRFGELLRAEVARTVKDAGEIEDEIRHVFSALDP